MEALAQAIMPPVRGGEQRSSFAKCFMEAAGDARGLLKNVSPEDIFASGVYQREKEELVKERPPQATAAVVRG